MIFVALITFLKDVLDPGQLALPFLIASRVVARTFLLIEPPDEAALLPQTIACVTFSRDESPHAILQSVCPLTDVDPALSVVKSAEIVFLAFVVKAFVHASVWPLVAPVALNHTLDPAAVVGAPIDKLENPSPIEKVTFELTLVT